MSLSQTIAGSRLTATEIDFPESRAGRLARQLRARLLTKGITLRAFATRHNFRPRTVQAALRGERPTGKKTLLVLRKIEEETR